MVGPCRRERAAVHAAGSPRTGVAGARVRPAPVGLIRAERVLTDLGGVARVDVSAVWDRW